MIGVLKPTLQQEMGWTEGDFANIVFWFQVAYAVGLRLVIQDQAVTQHVECECLDVFRQHVIAPG